MKGVNYMKDELYGVAEDTENYIVQETENDDTNQDFGNDGLTEGIPKPPAEAATENREDEGADAADASAGAESSDSPGEGAAGSSTDDKSKGVDGDDKGTDTGSNADLPGNNGRKSDEPRVPQARLNKEVAQRRSLERELAKRDAEIERLRAERAQPVKTADDDATLEATLEASGLTDDEIRAYNAAFVAGKDDETRKILNKVLARSAKTAVEAGASRAAAIATEQALESIRLDQQRVEMESYVGKLVQYIPELNPKDAAFRPDLQDDIVAQRDLYVSRGHSYPAALRMATSLFLRNEGYDMGDDGLPFQGEVAHVAKAGRTVETMQRQVADKHRRLNDAPPTPSTGSKKSVDAYNLMQMSDAEIEALPRDVLDELFGNTV